MSVDYLNPHVEGVTEERCTHCGSFEPNPGDWPRCCHCGEPVCPGHALELFGGDVACETCNSERAERKNVIDFHREHSA